MVFPFYATAKISVHKLSVLLHFALALAYNIMISDEGLWIIDWPQWVTPTHKNAEATLLHDLETVAEFFRKKYQIEPDVEAAAAFIKSA